MKQKAGESRIRLFFSNISLRAKLLSIYILVVMIPLVVISVYLAVFLHGDIVAREEKEVSTQATRAAGSYAYIFSTVDKTAQDIYLASAIYDVLGTAYVSDAEFAAAYTERLEPLFRNSSDFSYIDALTLYTEAEIASVGHIVKADQSVLNTSWYRSASRQTEKGAYFWTVNFTEKPVAPGVTKRILSAYKTLNLDEFVGVLATDVNIDIIGMEFDSEMRDHFIVNANNYIVYTNLEELAGTQYAEFDSRFLTGADADYYNGSGAEKRYVAYNRFYIGGDNTKPWYAVVSSPETRLLSSVNRVMLWVVFLFVAVFAVMFLLLLMVVGSITRRINRLKESTADIVAGDYTRKIGIEGNDEIGGLSRDFNQMSETLNRLINETYKQKFDLQAMEIKQKQAEIYTLQEQINPHFLYNTLETIRMHAILKEDIEVADMLVLLAKLFRYNIDVARAEATVRDEIEYIGNYVEMLNLRAKSGTRLICDVPEEIQDCRILKLTLQPLVENSVKHGFKNTNRGEIRLTGRQEGGDIVLTLSDNGKGLTPDKAARYNASFEAGDASPDSNVGLLNVNNRLRLFFGAGHGLSIISGGKGTTIEIRLPKHQNGDGTHA